MTRNKESSTIGKLMSQIQWEKGDGNYQRAGVSALKVGRDFPGGRQCNIILQIDHDDKGWLWSTEALGLEIGREEVEYSKIYREGVEDSLEAAKGAAIAALPDIWSQLRDLTINKYLTKGEAEPPKEPSWNIRVNKIDNSTLKGFPN